MKSKIQFTTRILLGLIYFIFGGMGLAMALGLITAPDQPMPEAAKAFMNGIMATGYFFPLLKITETLGGLLLLIGIASPVVLIILAPITLNIILFHLFIEPLGGQLILPLIMVVAHISAMSAYWHLYRPLFGKGR